MTYYPAYGMEDQAKAKPKGNNVGKEVTGVQGLNQLIQERGKSLIRSTNFQASKGGDQVLTKITNLETADGSPVTQMIRSADFVPTDVNKPNDRRSVATIQGITGINNYEYYSFKVGITYDQRTYLESKTDKSSRVVRADSKIKLPIAMTKAELAKLQFYSGVLIDLNGDKLSKLEIADELFAEGGLYIVPPDHDF
jgi:hypothetical protein